MKMENGKCRMEKELSPQIAQMDTDFEKRLFAMMEYKQEDLSFMLHILMVILCVGFGFQIAALLFSILGLSQLLKAVRCRLAYINLCKSVQSVDATNAGGAQ